MILGKSEKSIKKNKEIKWIQKEKEAFGLL